VAATDVGAPLVGARFARRYTAADEFYGRVRSECCSKYRNDSHPYPTQACRPRLGPAWEGGRWHPFVGTGVGAYFLQFRSNGSTIGETETGFGLNTGGGLEYFFNRSVALKGEGRYHAVTNARGLDPSGIALTAGLKTYF
jgi:opacity protein-like surface antigen